MPFDYLSPANMAVAQEFLTESFTPTVVNGTLKVNDIEYDSCLEWFTMTQAQRRHIIRRNGNARKIPNKGSR